MKVAMLAAGVSLRLGMGEHAPPKALLRFDGETLLRRHLDILAHFGLFDLTLVVGHQAALIERELAALRPRHRMRTCYNPDYRTSSMLSLWTLCDVLRAGEPVLCMDADVLYDWRPARAPAAVAACRLHSDRPRCRSRPRMAGGADP